jgi:glycosyltransferase involved in cell wall biosynthesis
MAYIIADEHSVDAFDPIDFSVRPVVVAIPVHNEANYIADCLTALARQDYRHPFAVVLLLNNCTDDTARVARGLIASLPYCLNVHEQWLPPSSANAGMARNLAMRLAQEMAGDNGIILTTDADAQVTPNWIAANLAAMDAGADAVAGMALLDEQEFASIPIQLHRDEEKSEYFGTLLDEIDWLIDPDPADPWPRHTQHSGASIAVRSGCLTRAGGVPPIPLGEDRVLFDRLRRIDARIRHDRDVTVMVSARLVGRARGGMADTIARRLRERDRFLDSNLEPTDDHLRRAVYRFWARSIRAAGTTTESLARSLRLPVTKVAQAIAADTFGAAWSELERDSPILRHRIVGVSCLRRETARAEAVIADLKAGGFPRPAHRAENAVFVAALPPATVAVIGR